MPTYESTALVITDSSTNNSMQILLNSKKRIYLEDTNEDNPDPFCITFGKDEWDEIKNFIDRKFEISNQ